MAKSNAERQAAYRARHIRSENAGSSRLNFVISQPTKNALEQLALRYNVTQKEALERLILEAHQKEFTE